MLNRRKAMIGWLVYTGAKPIAKQALKSRAKKVKDTAVPGESKGSRRLPKVAAAAAAAGAVVGGLVFWRRRGGDQEGVVEAPSSDGASAETSASSSPSGTGASGSEA